ncbi:LysR family transcriptional regulator [Paraliomyxa miuraensis]|uniref:LysR substrate-binding domain-containing protein n=1 Tax=Paraliomyxa miuraensis TaxID=376150 RepID=UPI0022563149|nr:LysR family transcriptional regulator [Paraliomyxa miuraensis]MCX4243304.1 LysR family transcriptional regulator [Paraliomyxa miuraensis]
MLKLEWLEAFAVFGEHLNFTHAAKALHLSQPALHAQIRRLSETLGVPLYGREGRRLRLTAEGEEVLRFARQTRERSAAFVERLRTGHSRQPLVLAAGEGALLYLLGDAVRAFTARGPAPLRLLTRDLEGTLASLRRGEAHVGVAVIDPVPDDLRGTLLAEIPQALVLPRQHPLARRRTIPVSALSELPLVLPPEGRPQREALARALAREGGRLRPAVEATGWELAIHFVGLGLGFAVVNGCCRLPPGLVGRVVPGLPRVRYQVLHRADAEGHVGLAALLGTLHEHREAWRTRRSVAAARRPAER